MNGSVIPAIPQYIGGDEVDTVYEYVIVQSAVILSVFAYPDAAQIGISATHSFDPSPSGIISRDEIGVRPSEREGNHQTRDVEGDRVEAVF